MTNDSIIKEAEKYLMPTYARFPVAMVRGEGWKLMDADGREYIDFVSGIAVCNLGHCPPVVVEAVRRQVGQLIHVSNLFHIPPQVELAKLICQNCFGDKVFFCNSGAEANEAAVKLARKWAKDRGEPQRYRIITMENSFHGRTLATVAATGQKKFHKGFEPLPNMFDYVPFNDLEAAKNAVNSETCAIMVEPIQGEGGVVVPGDGYLAGLRELCDKEGILLIFDEVQVGIGRTGRLFAHQNYGVEPHMMTLAKALAGGIPIGALVARDDVAQSFSAGTHASTFGGNYIATSAGIAVMKALLESDILKNCREVGSYFSARLRELKQRYEFIKDVRGMGLIIGMELTIPCSDIVKDCMKRGYLVNCTSDKVLRFLPPLNIARGVVDGMIGALKDIFDELKSGGENV